MTSNSSTRLRSKGIPARNLTSQGYAVCLFPEQPRLNTFTEPVFSGGGEQIQRRVVKDVKASVTLHQAEPEPEYWRVHWRNRLVYLLAFISFSLSLNNIYYFPLHVFRYGDKFFLPYTVCTVFIGYPLHVLQVSLGQHGKRGLLWIWECCPLIGGIGVGMLIACVLTSMYYNIFAAYSLVYVARCFNRKLPWSNCTTLSSDAEVCHERIWSVITNGTLPAKHYFYNHVLNAPQKYPPEVWALGGAKWWLFLGLFFSWFLVYVATMRSARSIGRAAIFIVIFSYFVILMLLILFPFVKDSGKALKHASKGVTHTSYFSPEMWTVATMQVLLELGICHGIPLVYGSFCHFRNYLHIDSIILCLINYANSFIFFILFFSVLGTFLCDFDGFPWDVLYSSIGIIYILYSEVFAPLKGSSLWCVVFFSMLFVIIVGTQIAMTETIMTAIYDSYIESRYLLSNYRWLINIIICFFFFCLGIPFCFANGFYGAIFLETMPLWFSIMPLVFQFSIGVILIYGLDNYFENLEIMLMVTVSSEKRVVFYILLAIISLLTIGSFFIMDPSSVGDVFYYKKYAITSWVLFTLMLIPFIAWAVLWIISFKPEGKSITACADSWKYHREATKIGKGQFTEYYRPSYIWPW